MNLRNKLGVFIEPIGELKSKIINWKEKIHRIFPNASYCSHPPHSTLICISIKDIDIKKCIEMCQGVKISDSINVTFEKNLIFWNDLSTNGGHTITYKIKPTKNLLNLQNQIGEICSNYAIINNSVSNNYSSNEEMANSYRKYGFPFVGDHWIPHFTIASIHKDSNSEIFKRFLNEKFTFDFKLMDISFWHINGDNHKLIFKNKI